MAGPYDKQRRFPRIPAECPVLVRKLDGERTTRISCTKVVGLGGCMFRHDKPFGDGSLLNLLILVRERYLEMRGKVVYEIPREDKRFDIGVEFVEISEEDLAALAVLFEEPQDDPAPS